MQVGVTGLQWCDVLEWLENDVHLETFDDDFSAVYRNKRDVFFLIMIWIKVLNIIFC